MGLALVSCEKILDISYHDIEPLLVIEGELTEQGARVGLTLTTPMDEPTDRSRLTDATVSIADLTAGSVYSLTSDAEGYFTHPSPGIPGHVYRLSVERNGHVYEMQTLMNPATEILSAEFNWISMPYDKVAVLKVCYADNPAATGDCYWVKLYRNGEIYSWQEQDDRGASGGVNSFVMMTSRRDTSEEDDDQVLVDGDVMTISVTPVSAEMHSYLEALQNDSNGPSLFTGERVLGYFLASSPAECSVVFRPDEIPEYK